MRLLLMLAAGLPLLGQVSHERILKASAEPGNWLTYSGNYSGHRFSPLEQINDQNVARLKPVWSYQVNSLQKFESTPLVVDGVMYLSEAPSNVTALDTRTGRPLWKYRRNLPDDVRVCCGMVNRGVAVLGDLVYIGTVDAHLVAVDSKTGVVRWDTTVADYKAGYSITVAPLAVKDKIVVGMAGGEYGVRGFLDAYDSKTGKRAWRFWTVPGPGEPGNQSWKGDTWKTGSATTWVTGAYDPDSNLIYWGTGNPGPDWNGEQRGGDNLYSDCLIAVDADSWPSVSGSNNWYSPSYSPRTDLLYVATRESGSIYFLGEAEYKEGEQFNGGGFRSIPGEEEYGAIRALHPATGAVAWEYKLFTPPWAGVLATAGNLVFGSTNEGQASALQASSGKPLWRFQAGGIARSNPVSYTSDGKQYVAIAIGTALYVFGLE